VKILRFVILSLAYAGFVALAVSARQPETAAAKASSQDQRAEAEVRALNTGEVQAFLHNDPKAMAQLWSDDFVVTNPLNKFVTKRQVLGMVESGFLVITAYDRQIEYLRVYGDTVIVAGGETVTWGGKMPNAGKTEHLRFTGIWMKQGGRWQQVVRHANIVPQP
jgi:ketosteroid isomerase-like protein